jgi:hypothetical protein
MKTGLLKRISRDDLAKAGDALPRWVDVMLQPLNDFIEKVGLALQNKLTFRDNFSGKIIERKFTNDVEQEINPYPDSSRGALRPSACYPATTGNLFITGFKWVQKDNGNIGVTIKFTGGTEATVRLHIHLE